MHKRLIVVLLSVLIILTGLSGCRKRPTHLTILYVNDFHGHMEPFKEQGGDEHLVGGMAKIATLIKAVREEVEPKGGHVLLLCAGDILQGTPMSLVFKGEPEIRAMNQLRFDAMVIGNHEFDYGQENLERLKGLAAFPILSGNILTTSTDKPAAVDYIVNTYGDLDVAVFGLTTDETPVSTHPKNVEDLEFFQPVEIAEELVPVVRRNADIVVALTHIGFELDERLAEEVPGIDVIVGGHSHTRVDSTHRIGETLICQAFEYGIFLGRADLIVEGGQVVEVRNRLLKAHNGVAEDPWMSALVSDYASRLSEELDKPIGTTGVRLDGDRASVRSKETNLGDLVCDAMRLMARTDLALTNAGGIRASIERGEITSREVLTALPFGGQLVTLNLTGQQLAKILDRAAGLPPGSGGFLQVSGLSFRIAGKEAHDIQVAGEPLDEKRSYSVATNDFLAAGGDGYSAFKQSEGYYNTGLKISDVLMDFIRARRVVGTKVDTRIYRD